MTVEELLEPPFPDDDWEGFRIPDELPIEDPDAPVVLHGLLPDEFWNARPVFGHIRQAAHALCASGDVALWAVLTRLSGMLSHHIRAVTGVGPRASLNLFAAIVGPSGAGKSTGAAVARDLLGVPAGLDFRDGLPLGSGEGLAEVYMGQGKEPTGEIIRGGKRQGEPEMQPVRKQVRHNAFFYVDEGESITRTLERSGATIGEALRRAAVGETLGQTNADLMRSRCVPAGSYSMGLLVGFQPETAMPLLGDVVAGTPQRLFWAPAIDPSIPELPPEHPGQILDHPGHKVVTGPLDITFPDAIRRDLRRAQISRARGEIQPAHLDSHEPLMRVKAAAVLALLDHREHVNDEDWQLSHIMWSSSVALRDHLVFRAERQRLKDEQLREEKAIALATRMHGATSEADRAAERVGRTIARKVAETGALTRKAIREKIANRDRQFLTAGLDYAMARGWVVDEGGRYGSGDVFPLP